MKEALSIAGAAAAALAVVAASIFAFGDREMLVSPPEAIAENFVRALSTGRYDVAMRYVDPRAGVSRDDIRRWSDELRKQAGGIQNVEVPSVSMQDGTAAAVYVVMTTSGREITGQLKLAFDRKWRITR